MGKEVIREDEDHIFVRTGAGENWHGFVEYCIGKGFAGVENLALIPGRNGASPIQNIGAYGVEVKDVFHELEAWHLEEEKLYTFTASDCAFGYRDSVFKTRYKGEFMITSVTYRLNKKPKFHTSYGAIAQELEKMGVQDLSIRAIGDAVISIRKSKLPDPAVIGNAGSFFKNPEVDQAKFDELKMGYPDIVGYSLPGGRVIGKAILACMKSRPWCLSIMARPVAERSTNSARKFCSACRKCSVCCWSGRSI
jgi:UDP-N-acetylmuramate dehydrogenase